MYGVYEVLLFTVVVVGELLYVGELLRFGLDYLFFLFHSLVILLLLAGADEKTTKNNFRDTLKFNLYSTSLLLFHGGTFFPSQEKSSLLSRMVLRDVTKIFSLMIRSPSFSGMRGSHFLSEASWKIVIFVCVYFIL